MPSGQEKKVTVKVLNLEDFQMDFKCNFSIDGGLLVNAVKVMGTDFIECDSITFQYSGSSPHRNVPFQITWGGLDLKPLDNPDIIQVKVYKCTYMTNDCGGCLMVEPKYNCGWCDNQCMIQQYCTAGKTWLNNSQDCPYPIIINTPFFDSVSPTYGPEIGGTSIVIRGELLSSNFVQFPLTVMLEPVEIPGIGEQCNVTFENDTVIHCHTTIDPSRRAAGKSYTVLVYHPSSPSYWLFAPDKFTFKPNSNITEVYPLDSIVQGGVLLTVNGRDLNSVKYPLMRVKCKYMDPETMVNSTWWTNYTLCTVQNSTQMVCPTPPIYQYLSLKYLYRLNDDNTEIVNPSKSKNVPQRKKRSSTEPKSTLLGILKDFVSALLPESTGSRQQRKRQSDTETITINDENLEFTLGFKLDGVLSVEDLEKDNDLKQFAKVDVYLNPIFEEFSPLVQTIPSSWPSKQENPQTIVSTRMNMGVRIDDYTVMVGHKMCAVTELTSDSLTFVPPINEPDDNGLHSQDGGKIVSLRAGNINKGIGYLKYKGFWESGAFIGMMVAVIIILLIIIAIVVCCWYRHRVPGKPYVGVPQKEKHILQQIDSELRMQIGKALLKDPDNLQVGNEVGKGNFGKVYSGHLVDPVTREKKHVAVKTMRGDTNMDSIEEFLKEAIVMKNFKHPNILPLLGVVIKENIPNVILPFMDNGDLRIFISNEKNRFTVRELVTFGLDVAQGMSYLEDQRFVHRDLAARNCMVDKEKRILIAHFGLARDIHVADYYRVEDKSRPLPIRWMAIESIELQRFTTKSDVWSFGIVLWELLSRGMKPYPGVDNLDIRQFLKRGNRLEQPSHSPPELYQVMKKCWETRAEDRPTFHQLVVILENLLGGRKPDASPNRPNEIQSTSTATPPSSTFEGYTGLQQQTPPQATYLELVDMPSGESVLQGYSPMK